MVLYLNFGLLLIILGLISRYARFKRNYIYGYRTHRSMKSDSHWVYANKTMGQYAIILGIASMTLGLIFWYLSFSPIYILFGTLAILLVLIIIIENRLKEFENSEKK